MRADQERGERLEKERERGRSYVSVIYILIGGPGRVWSNREAGCWRWVVSGYLGYTQRTEGEGAWLSAGAAMTTKVLKVLKVPCKGRRSKVREESPAPQPLPSTFWVLHGCSSPGLHKPV